MTDLPVRLEVQTPTGWLDVLGRASTLTVSRSPMQLGTLTATILDTTLDPAQADTLASGSAIRLHARTPSGWRPVYTGKISAAKVSYAKAEPGADPTKAARIEVTAVDLMQPLGSTVEPRSVHTADALRTLLGASGLPWRVNGTTTAGPASPLVVARNEGAYLADQVAITRDTLRGHAWVDATDTLQVYEPDQMPTGPAATYTDVEDGHCSYSAVDTSYDSADVVDEVAVTFLRYKVVGNATEEITYGPYRRPGATGTNVRTYTIVGDVEDEAAIEVYAMAVLDRHAVAQVRPLGLSTPVRDDAERLAAVQAEPCALVRVAVEGRVDALVRVETIEHTITAVTGVPDPVQWVATYTYGTPEAVPESQRLALVRAVPVLDRFETVEAVAAEGVDPAATAGRLTGQTVTGVDLRTADTGARWQLGTGANAGRLMASAAGDDDAAGGLNVVSFNSGNPIVRTWVTELLTPLVRGRRGALRFLMSGSVTGPLSGVTAEIEADTIDFLGTVDRGNLAPAGQFAASIRAALGARSGVRTVGPFTAVNTPASYAVAFPEGAFTAPPSVLLTVTGVGSPRFTLVASGSITATGFSIRAERTSGLAAFDVAWQATPA